MTPRDSIKDGRLSLRGGHAPERLRYKFDKALDFDLFEIAPPLEVLLQNRKDKAASIACESAPQALAHGGEHDDQVDALVNLILGLVVERIAPQEVYYV